MLASVEKLQDAPIVVVTYGAPFEPNVDIAAAQVEIAAILDQSGTPLFRIDDLSQAQMDWNQFLLGIAAATQDVPGSMTDKRIRGILVGDYEMVQLASESMTQEQYGATHTPMFTSLADAIAHAKTVA